MKTRVETVEALRESMINGTGYARIAARLDCGRQERMSEHTDSLLFHSFINIPLKCKFPLNHFL